MTHPFLPLPEDDDALILRADCHLYGFPAPQTLARWACHPSEAPAPLPYLLVGRRAAYLVGDLRRVRKAQTFSSTTERSEAPKHRLASLEK